MEDRDIAKEIAKLVKDRGGESYFVGGYVRDKLLHKDNKDIDIEIHYLMPEILKDILSSVGDITEYGKSFGVFRIKGYDLDISLPRRETSKGDKHTDFDVETDPFIGQKEASKRRDFTINALMENAFTGDVVDYWGGLKDLERKLVKHVNNESFAEDPLRVLRACQFSARFGFTVDDSTRELCKKINLESLSKERIFEELKKALLKADKPSIFFEELRKMEQLDMWFPEVKALIGVPQHEEKHQEGDVWTHTMMVLDEASKVKYETDKPLELMLSALCHDFGKTVCSEKGSDGYTHSYKHEEVGLPLVETFIERLTNETSLKHFVLNMVEMHQQPNQCYNASSKTKATNKMFDKSISPKDLLLLSYCDNQGKIPQKDNRAFLEERLKIYNETMAKPYVSGKDLIQAGLKPSKSFSVLLEHSHKLRLAGVDKENALKQTLALTKKQKSKVYER